MSQELAELLRQRIDEFDHHLKARNYSRRTRHCYRGALRELAAWVRADEQLNNLTDLTPQVLESYWHETCFRAPRKQRKRGQKKLSAGTLRIHAAALRRFFRELTRRQELLADPSTSIGSPRRTETVKRAVLSQREVLKLLMAIELDSSQGLRDRALVEVLYATGVRRGELLGLNLEDVDLDSGWLHVLGKGRKVRMVPLGREAELALQAYLRDARPHLAAADNKALFVGPLGHRYKASELAKFLHQLAAKANLKKRVTPHVLRHSCATHMLAGKADIRYIQALLGHSSIKSTQVYTRVELSELQQVVRTCHPRERDL